MAFTVGLVLLYQHMTATSADDLGSGTVAMLPIGMIVCVLGLVLSLTVFVIVLIALVRTRQGDGLPSGG